MRTLSLPQQRNCVPHAASERRAAEIHEPPTDHYGTTLANAPQREREVPLYFFVGGTASAAALTACIADWLSGDDRLVNHAHWVATGAGLMSGALMTTDAGGWHRLTSMLDVFKQQHPMNGSAWTLAIFSTFSGAAAFANQMRQEVDAMPMLVLENLSEAIAAVTGVFMSTRSGGRSDGNRVPLRNDKTGHLRMHLAASGMNSAVSILELLGHNDSRALNLLGLVSAAYECLAGLMTDTGHMQPDEPKGKSERGVWAHAGRILSGPLPLLLRTAHMFTRNRDLRRVAAYSSLAGSLLTRLGSLHAGKASANHSGLSPERAA